MILTSTDGQTDLPRYFAQSFKVAQKIKSGRLDIRYRDILLLYTVYYNRTRGATVKGR